MVTWLHQNVGVGGPARHSARHSRSLMRCVLGVLGWLMRCVLLNKELPFYS